MRPLTVNVYAENYGWLFEDLKRHFSAAASHALTVTATTEPLSQADCWICLRTTETHRTPDSTRTLACIHDFFNDTDLYSGLGARRGVRDAAALWLCHPGIRSLLARAGVNLAQKRLLERPIGAMTAFSPRSSLPPRFTVGWIGRNDPIKRLPILTETLTQFEFECEVLLIGEDLQDAAADLKASGRVVHHHDRRKVPIEACPTLYRQMDVLVITSASEGQPLVLFEALASGVPVIASSVGWAPDLAAMAPSFVRLAEGASEITAALAELRPRQAREALFAQRQSMADLVQPWLLESWVRDMLHLAIELPHGDFA